MSQWSIYRKHYLANKWLYLYTIFVIYITDSFLFATYDNSTVTNLGRFSVIIVAIVLFCYEYIYRRKEAPILILGLSVSIIISACLAGRFFNGYSYYSFVACLWICQFASSRISLEDFAESYCNVMIVLTIASLVGWGFAEQIKNMAIFPVIENTVGCSYAFLGLTTIPIAYNHALRNMGIFWEPGAYQFYLVVALYFTLFVVQKKKKLFSIVIFVGGAISTISGVVMIPIVLLLIAYLLQERKFKVALLVFVLSIGVFAVFQSGMMDSALNKLNGEGGSIYYRWIGIEGSLKAFFRSPIFGSSPEVNMAIKSELAIEYLGNRYSSNANTFFNYFAYYGLIVGGFFFVRSYKLFCNNPYITRISALICFVGFFVSSSNENFMDSIFVVNLMFLKYSGSLEGEHEGITDQCL